MSPAVPDLSKDLLTRRSMIQASAGAMAVFLAGCSSAAHSNSGGPSASAGASGSSGGSLTVGTVTDFAPTTILRAGTNETALALVYDTMAVIDPTTLTTQPSVATSWSWNADKTVLTVNLRDDVRYQSGRLLAPEDVIFSVKAEQATTSGAQIGGMATHIKKMAKTGAHQITFTLERPISAFVDLLVMTPLIDSETYKEVATAKKVIGTGPFIFEKWTPGNSIQYKRNPHYWQTGKPYLDAVKVRIFGSEQALVAALRANEIDLAFNLVPSDATLLAKSKFPSVSTGAKLFNEWYVGANVKVAPLNDLKVRQAIAYALDRPRIVKQAFSTFGAVSDVPWSTALQGLSAAESTHYTYDLAKAKALFKAAGAPSQTIPVMIASGSTIAEAILNIVQYNLTAVGFKVKAEQVQTTQYQTLLEDAKMPGLWINSVGQVDLAIPAVLLGNAPFKITENTSNVTDAQYIKLANDLIYSSTAAQTASATKALTDYVVDQAWHMTVGHVPLVSASTPKVSGVGTTAGFALTLTDAKLA
jgi:peptide/nickel transport system substrate-binding protein